jgi:NAD-dependent protein deacetylase/lipoamidase
MAWADRGCRNIVILTGAGISQESGLETFRDKEGIWSRVRPEEVATPNAFVRNPERVHDFYNLRRRQLLSSTVKPNAAHFALAELEQQWEGRLMLVTQNIDDLHERAGSRNLIHMHGELLKSRCQVCARVQPCFEDLDVSTICTACGSTGALRPHVVWFGEVPLFMDEILQELEGVDLFIAIGTSGNVYPAAGFAERASLVGAVVAELNMEPSASAGSYEERIYGPATSTVPSYVHRLLNKERV